MNQKQLSALTIWLKNNVFRNPDAMYPRYNESEDESIIEIDGENILMTDIIASLHNLLYEAITGERYNYMFHWANKIGAWCEDDIFDELIKEGEENENVKA